MLHCLELKTGGYRFEKVSCEKNVFRELFQLIWMPAQQNTCHISTKII